MCLPSFACPELACPEFIEGSKGKLARRGGEGLGEVEIGLYPS